MNRTKASRKRYARRPLIATSAGVLAFFMALSAPLSASAASSVMWDGNSQKGSWVGAGTPKSNKVNAYGKTMFVTRVGVRVNGNVSNGGGSVIVTYATKSYPDIFCRWDQGSGSVRSIKCVNYW